MSADLIFHPKVYMASSWKSEVDVYVGGASSEDSLICRRKILVQTLPLEAQQDVCWSHMPFSLARTTCVV